MIDIWPVVVWVGIVIAVFTIGILLEKKSFNKGYCPKCGERFTHFDVDSHGSRGYVCYNCCNYVWVSYKFVDKKFLEEEVKSNDQD